MVDADTLVPQDHLLRKIEKVMDYDWLYERLSPYYCANNGHPGSQKRFWRTAEFRFFLTFATKERKTPSALGILLTTRQTTVLFVPEDMNRDIQLPEKTENAPTEVPQRSVRTARVEAFAERTKRTESVHHSHLAGISRFRGATA